MEQPLCTMQKNIWQEEGEMKKGKKWLKPVLFTAGGALIGLAHYYFVGCSTGACPLTANPFITMAYMGLVGWLLSGVFGKECESGCNM